MESHVKQLLSKLSSRDLLRLCNEKMVCAARDLAEFTKNGINASFIVALAHKCEVFEEALADTPLQEEAGDKRQVKEEIQEAVSRICETGREIWSRDPSKYRDYVISVQAQGLPRVPRRPLR